MGEFMDQVPEAVQKHIRSIAGTAGLPDTEESYERFAEGWLEKRAVFEERVSDNGMEEREEFASDESHGGLLLTYSGSLLTIGPLIDDKRAVDYHSIGIRMDVPEEARAEETGLSEDVSIDAIATFTNGPVKSSSAIYAIAVAAGDLDPDEEVDLLAEVTRVLAEEFVEINKTIIQS